MRRGLREQELDEEAAAKMDGQAGEGERLIADEEFEQRQKRERHRHREKPMKMEIKYADDDGRRRHRECSR